MPDPINELTSALGDLAGGRASGENERLVPPGSRPCPICGDHMQIDSVQGVSVDCCPRHGLWLDNSELPTILARGRGKSSVAQRRAVRQARSDGKVAGTLFGVWSFLLD